MIKQESITAKLIRWSGWLFAAALLLLACNSLTPTPTATPEQGQSDAVPAVITVERIVEVEREVTRLVEVVITGIPPTSSNNDSGTGITSPPLISGTSTPGFNPTRPAFPEPTPGPTQIPLLPGQSNFTAAEMQLLVEVWRLVQENFDGQIPNNQELVDAIIAAALDTLGDQFTVYLNAATAQRSREAFEGSYEGIGAYVRQNDEGYFVITRPIAGQPAALAGLRPGDIVLAADGVSLIGLTIDQSISLVRGPNNTAVTLTILREGVAEPFEVTIVRQRIVIPIVEFSPQLLEGDIAYVRLTSFNAQAYTQLNNALETLLAQNPRGLILDLRDNPGGFLNQSIAVADLFLPQGVVLYERNIRGLQEVFESRSGDIAEQIPLVVLVNPGSASASEIVAGAIQDRGRGIIIGETSFGKGSVQSVYTLSDGSELRVTIARWYTPNNQTIDGAGITPDIEETPSPLEFGGPDDNQLQRAIQYLLTGE
ncbi:MAG: S41 family peptidase [Anaerolineae bacterium]|nr:S41 family peptidase [Anaerolineae bacterium]